MNWFVQFYREELQIPGDIPWSAYVLNPQLSWEGLKALMRAAEEVNSGKPGEIIFVGPRFRVAVANWPERQIKGFAYSDYQPGFTDGLEIMRLSHDEAVSLIANWTMQARTEGRKNVLPEKDAELIRALYWEKDDKLLHTNRSVLNVLWTMDFCCGVWWNRMTFAGRGIYLVAKNIGSGVGEYWALREVLARKFGIRAEGEKEVAKALVLLAFSGAARTEVW